MSGRGIEAVMGRGGGFRWGSYLFVLGAVLVFSSLVSLHVPPLSSLLISYHGGPPPIDPETEHAAHALLSPSSSTTPPDTQLTVLRLARFLFVSCNRQAMYNPFWNIIHTTLKPQVFIWMGDNIYADHTGSQLQVGLSLVAKALTAPHKFIKSFAMRQGALFDPATPEIISECYDKVKSHPTYTKIRRETPHLFITGTWDDHDYGVNDGDKTYIHREASKKLFLDFLDAPKADPRRKPDFPGIYTAEYFNIPLPAPPKTVGTRDANSASRPSAVRVGLILLDLRYNKDPWSIANATEMGDFLGEKQWSWLAKTLERKTDVNVVVSSIQVLPEDRGFIEVWSRFSKSRERLLNLLLNAPTKQTIILSGDVHFAEASSARCRPKGSVGTEEGREVRLWEFSSSGLTHSTRRVKFLGFYLDMVMRWIFPTRFTDVRESDGQKQLFTGRNAGVLDLIEERRVSVDKEGVRSSIIKFRATILDSKKQTRIWREVPFSDGEVGGRGGKLEWACGPISSGEGGTGSPLEELPLGAGVRQKRLRLAYQTLCLVALGLLFLTMGSAVIIASLIFQIIGSGVHSLRMLLWHGASPDPVLKTKKIE